MTGYDVFKRALALLNYTDTRGEINAANSSDLFKRGLAIVNQIYADLWYTNSKAEFVPLESMNDKVMLSGYATNNVMVYGVAMLVAQSDGDGDNQALYASLYNQRRASARSASDSITDVLPTVCM